MLEPKYTELSRDDCHLGKKMKCINSGTERRSQIFNNTEEYKIHSDPAKYNNHIRDEQIVSPDSVHSFLNWSTI